MKMKEVTEWSVFIITLLLSLMIFGMVVIEFEALDTTIVAGIIAFIGAVLGGGITLVGVQKTITANRESDIRREKIDYSSKRELVRRDIMSTLRRMKYSLIVTENATGEYEDNFDQKIMKNIFEMQELCEGLVRRGIEVREYSVEKLEKLQMALENYVDLYYEWKEDYEKYEDEPEESSFLLEIYDKEEIFESLHERIDECYENIKMIPKETLEDSY